MGNVRDGTRDLNNKTSAIPVTLQELHWIFSSDHLPLYSDIPAIHFYSYHYHCSFSFSNTFTFIFHWPLKRLQKIPVTILHLFTTALKGNDSTMFSEGSSARAKKIYPFLWSAKWIHNPLLVLLLMGVLLCPPLTLVHVLSDMCVSSDPSADRNILTMQLRGLLAFTILVFSLRIRLRGWQGIKHFLA